MTFALIKNPLCSSRVFPTVWPPRSCPTLSFFCPCFVAPTFAHRTAPLYQAQRLLILRPRRHAAPLPLRVSYPRHQRRLRLNACAEASRVDPLDENSALDLAPVRDGKKNRSVNKSRSPSRSPTAVPLPSSQPLTDSYSAGERRARSERLRSLWKDPEWRASMLAKRRSKDSVQRKSDKLKAMWSDPAWRTMMRQARIGRPAPNKGIAPSKATRLRMSMVRRGKTKSEQTKHRMSVARRKIAENDDWCKVISDSKKGKTRQYFALRREFRALHRDLKLWSDSHRARYGCLPHPDTFEKYVAPMMVFRIRRYLMLRDTLGIESAGVTIDIFI